MKGKIVVIIVLLILVLGSFEAVGYNLDIKIKPTQDSKDILLSPTRLSNDDIAILQSMARSQEWTFEVGKTSATNCSIDELCGFQTPENLEEFKCNNQKIGTTSMADLPPHWDWREQNGCTPIKNQKYCGSCWAFATVGPLESAIKIKTGQNVDLSEQWLVSCNTHGWGCQGGFWAFDYFVDRPDKCGGTGAVLEKYFPYSGINSPCEGLYPHDYFLADRDGDGICWDFVGDENDVPPVEKIKEAIYNYGPVAVALYVNNAFRAYKGGVFNANSYGTPNHAVVLVGWDDTKGKNGVWILKNSWGTSWGENGYMEIEYGCCEVGYSACYIEGFKREGQDDDVKIKVHLNIHELTNDPKKGDFDSIDPLLFIKPEWYYRVGLKSGNKEPVYFYRYNKLSDCLTPGNYSDYQHQYTWKIDADYVFNSTSPTAEITIKLMDFDETNPSDIADVSQYPGGGLYDSTDDLRRAIYHGIYNLVTNELTGDDIAQDGDYKITVGDGANNAKVWFKITDDYDGEKYRPKIKVDPDNLDFGNVTQGEFSKTFQIKNIAPRDPIGWAENLKWSATVDKNWIILNQKTGSLPSNTFHTITVTINATSIQGEGTHHGLITISSNDKQKTINVTVIIDRARTKNIHILHSFLQKLKDSFQNFFVFYKTIVYLNANNKNIRKFTSKW